MSLRSNTVQRGKKIRPGALFYSKGGLAPVPASGRLLCFHLFRYVLNDRGYDLQCLLCCNLVDLLNCKAGMDENIVPEINVLRHEHKVDLPASAVYIDDSPELVLLDDL